MFALFVCLPAVALQTTPPLEPPAFRLDSGAAVQRLDGALWAFGTDYKASLTGQAIEFVPALGQRAPHNLPLRLSLLALERGGQPFASPWATAHRETLDEAHDRAERPVAPGIVELLQATEAGLELSYRFEQRPAGDGDLVVRLALDSELPLCSAGPQGLEFAAPGLGGVRIGAVTGIDSRGARAAGDLRLVESEGQRLLELSLPDAFVDAAQFPLLLDPLIGTALSVDPTASVDEFSPDAVWSNSESRWLVTWELAFSATDHDVRVRGVAADGSAIGVPTSLDLNTLTRAENPQIAAFDESNRLLVLWRVNAPAAGSVYCRAFAPDLSGVTGLVTVFSILSQKTLGADIAGRRSGGNSGLILTLFQSSLNSRDCRVMRVNVPASGDPTFGAAIVLESGKLEFPRLARFPDQQGRFFAAWKTTDEFSFFKPRLRLSRLGITGTPLATPSTITPNGLPLGLDIDQSTDGQRYLVSLSANESFQSGTIMRLRAFTYSWTDTPGPDLSNFVQQAEFETQNLGGSVNEYAPVGALLCGQSAYLVRNLGNGSSPTQWRAQFLRGVRETGATISTQTFPINDPESASAIASRGNGTSTTNDELLLLYSNGNELFAQAAEVFGQGQVTQLGGGCGSGGSVQVSGSAVIGHPGLPIGHSGAPAGTSLAVLNIAFQPLPLACGSCLWNPFQVTAIQPVFGTTIQPLVLQIPLQLSLLGKQIELQWTLVGTPDSPCALSPGVAASNRVGLTIAE